MPLASLPHSSSPSRSRSILNFFTLRFRPTPPLPSTTSPLPCAALAKERRDAALRERGLLPPLKQNKDLSRQERDHDRQLPVAATIDSPTTVTAANLIKKEWEAKNPPVNGGESRDIGGQMSEQDTLCEEIPPLPGQRDDFTDSRHAVILGTMGNPPQGDDAPSQLSPTWHPETGLAPSSPTILHLPADTTAKHGPSETTLKRVMPIPITPIISLSPAAEQLDPKDRDVHRRKSSVSESQTSLATPSLDAPSFSTGISLPGTAENSPRIKTSGVRNIPMIVESPIEEGPLPEMSITAATPNLEAQQEQYQDIQTRRKKRNPFGQDPSRRLTVSASLTNMRRSVANTLSRTKSNLKVPKLGDAFDASHLPPSPTYPFSGRRSLDASATTLRQPVSPTWHNRASILLETSAIEDEETRRMTEVAFLD